MNRDLTTKANVTFSETPSSYLLGPLMVADDKNHPAMAPS